MLLIGLFYLYISYAFQLRERSSGRRCKTSFLIRNMSSTRNSLPVKEQMVCENEVEQVELLHGVDDLYGGVIVKLTEYMDSITFDSRLKASISMWRHKGKRAVWIKLPIKLSNLVDPAVQAGFRYHHAEPDYLMLVNWLASSPDTIPVNASHRVGIGAFVVNDNREVLVVQEGSGGFKGTGVWKLPTGVVDAGEDICDAAVREVKEETGIEAEFVEILAFRQSHRSFFDKSDIFFVCMLRPLSLDIEKQDSEIEAAQWMPIEEYVNQPYNKQHQIFKSIAEICKNKLEEDYAGFSAIPTATASGKLTYLYFNNRDFRKL
ncbi:nudix hydrolase 7-like isoform X2 [Euphorbia lathyris]|uniref:nudix hydrolase 7-like isoform X2 n=1 Tax=Euphorbia lathyris TaxID=212925 RepID=UPI003313F57C